MPQRIFIPRRILRKRMIDHGLDPEREWLPLTRGPLEHLKQYSKLDVALDPYPNGGCTTTCESLVDGCTGNHVERDRTM